MQLRHELQLRVRYQETDAQGRVHHANYLGYFEMGRIELLRTNGHSYRELEAAGIRLVVAEASLRYHAAAVFDDQLTLVTVQTAAKGARIVHQYQLLRGDQVLVEGMTVVACTDAEGRVRRLPQWLRDG